MSGRSENLATMRTTVSPLADVLLRALKDQGVEFVAGDGTGEGQVEPVVHGLPGVFGADQSGQVAVGEFSGVEVPSVDAVALLGVA